MSSSDIGIRVVVLGVSEARRSIGMVRSDLNGLTASIETASGVTSALATRLSALGSGLSRFGRTLSLTVTTPIAALGGSLVAAGIEFEDAFAGVAKTVEGIAVGFDEAAIAMYGTADALTADQKAAVYASEAFGSLTDDGIRIRNKFRALALDIPTSAAELARIGETAGALGVPASQITKFTETIAKLGVATNIGTDEAGNAIARFANIMGISGDNLAEFATRAGSALVDLGNKSAATESDIVAMAYRISGAGKAVGLTAQEIIGLSTSVAELGIQSEQGGSAVSRIFLEMSSAVAEGGDKLAEYAKVAGLTTEEFKNLVKTSPLKAFQLLASGLATMQEQGTLASSTLTDLDLNTIRLRDVINRFGPDMGNLTTNIEDANKAWAEGIALDEEAEKRYKTVKSQIQLLKNAFAELGIVIFDLYKNEISKLVTGFRDLVKGLSETDSKLIKMVVKIALIAAAIGPVLVVLGTLMQLIGVAIGGLAILGPIFGGVAVVAALAAVAIVSLGKSLSGIKVDKGTVKGLKDFAYWISEAFKYGKNKLGGNIFTGIGSALKALTYIYKDNKRTFFSEILKSFGMGEESANQLGMKIRDFLTPILLTLSDTFNKIGSVVSNVVTLIKEGDFGGALKTSLTGILELFGMSEENATKVVDSLKNIATEVLNFGIGLSAFFLDHVLPIIQEVSRYIVEEFIPQVVPIVENLVVALIGLWNKTSPALSSLLDWFGKTALPVIEGFLNTVLPLIEKFTEQLSKNPEGLLSIGAFFISWKLLSIDTIIGGTTKVIRLLSSAMAGLGVSSLTALGIFSALVLILLSWDEIAANFKDSTNQLGKDLQEGDFVGVLKDIVKMSLIDIPLGISTWIGASLSINVPEGLKAWKTVLDSIKVIVEWIYNNVANYISNLDIKVPDGLQKVYDLISGIYDKLQNSAIAKVLGVSEEEVSGVRQTTTPSTRPAYNRLGGDLSEGYRGTTNPYAQMFSPLGNTNNTSNTTIYSPTINGVPIQNEQTLGDKLWQAWTNMKTTYG